MNKAEVTLELVRLLYDYALEDYQCLEDDDRKFPEVITDMYNSIYDNLHFSE
jgi:hypothetical protein